MRNLNRAFIVCLNVLLTLSVGRLWAAENTNLVLGELSPNHIARSFDTLNHLTKESYTAVYSRQQQLGNNLFSELKSAMNEIPSQAWAQALWQKTSGSCGELILESVVPKNKWRITRRECPTNKILGQVEMTVLGGQVFISATWDDWRAKLNLGRRSLGQTLSCRILFNEGSMQSSVCENLAMASPQGEEIYLDKVVYDQGSANILTAEGTFFGLYGQTEELVLKAPSRSTKIFVNLTSRRKKFEEESKKVAAQPVKSEEEVMAELQAMAEDWDEWKVHEVVHGKNVKPESRNNDEYLAQEFNQEFLADGEEAESSEHSADLEEEFEDSEDKYEVAEDESEDDPMDEEWDSEAWNELEDQQSEHISER